MSKPEPLNIILRRRADDREVVALRNVAELNKLGSIADFSAKSDFKVKGALVSRKIAEQNDRLRDRLDERRRRLAELLTAERSAFEAEFMASFETPEQVKARCVIHRPPLNNTGKTGAMMISACSQHAAVAAVCDHCLTFSCLASVGAMGRCRLC